MVSSIKEYAIFMLDPQGNIISWNLGAEGIKGYRSEEIIGRHVSVFYPETDVQNGKPEEELRIRSPQRRQPAETCSAGFEVAQSGWSPGTRANKKPPCDQGNPGRYPHGVARGAGRGQKLSAGSQQLYSEACGFRTIPHDRKTIRAY